MGIGILELIIIIFLVCIIVIPVILVPILAATRRRGDPSGPLTSGAIRRQRARLRALREEGILTKQEYEAKLQLLKQRSARRG